MAEHIALVHEGQESLIPCIIFAYYGGGGLKKGQKSTYVVYEWSLTTYSDKCTYV